MSATAEDTRTVWERIRPKLRFSSPPPKKVEEDALSLAESADEVLSQAMSRMRKASQKHHDVAKKLSDRTLKPVQQKLQPIDLENEPTQKTRLPSRERDGFK